MVPASPAFICAENVTVALTEPSDVTIEAVGAVMVAANLAAATVALETAVVPPMVTRVPTVSWLVANQAEIAVGTESAFTGRITESVSFAYCEAAKASGQSVPLTRSAHSLKAGASTPIAVARRVAVS